MLVKVELFWSPACFTCNLTRAFLVKQGVAFLEKDVTDPLFREELMARGFMSAPVTFVAGEGHFGFDQAQLARVLGEAKNTAQLGQENLISELAKSDAIHAVVDKLLLAWKHAVETFPESTLDRSAGVGDELKTLRWFLHHVPRHFKATMLTRATGHWEEESVGDPPFYTTPGWKVQADTAWLAAHCDGIRIEYAAWAETLTAEELDRICDGKYGSVRLRRLIEISSARQAFQLGKLYRHMRDGLGIEPELPVPDEELTALGSPARAVA